MKYFNQILICTVLLLNTYNSFGQNDTLLLNKFNNEIIQPYIKSSNVLKEQVYIHFNKSCYLPGEEIWFKAYVINPATGLLNPYTRNLYVELYNEKGKLIGSKIMEVKNGTANNVLKIDYREQPGRYTFRAYTKWMKNFYPSVEFDNPLEIVGKSEAKEIVGEDFRYDVQFFPESGTLLAGTTNKVAIKALNPNGKAIALKGIIYNEKNDSIASFDLGNMGMGQVVLTPENNTVYKAKIILPSGKEETIPLPKVETKGVITSINVFSGNRIMAEVKSNDETIEKERLFYILVHANGNVYQTYTTRLSPEKSSVTFSLDRNSVGNGVNYLTVFDESFHPVCERLFYNHQKEIKGKLDIQSSPAKDSTEFRLRILNDSVKHNFSRLSISVLPGGTVSNHFTSSLLSDVLLRSGIRGKIENPSYYLEKQDNEHRIAMDLLMLTQGWRKYEWEKITTDKAGNNPGNNNFENGFTIEGTVKNWLNGKENKNSSISILSPKNKLFTVAKVDSTGYFSFAGLSLLDSSRVVVSAASSKGKGWNRTIAASVNPNYIPDSIIKVRPYIILPDDQKEKTEEPIKLMPGAIQLPEFVITERRKKPFENSIYVSPFDRVVEITKEKCLAYSQLKNLLRSEFNVRIEFPPGEDCQIDMGRGSSWTYVRGQKPVPPKVFVDEVEVDPCVLSMFAIEQIEAVSVNKVGNSFTGDGGGIFIKTRKVPLEWGNSGLTNIKSLLIKGYSPPVKYYTPKYTQTPETEAFQKYASIYWKPDVVIDSTGVITFKFNAPKETDKLNVRVEGISDDGTVFLEEKQLHELRTNSINEIAGNKF